MKQWSRFILTAKKPQKSSFKVIVLKRSAIKIRGQRHWNDFILSKQFKMSQETQNTANNTLERTKGRNH